MDEIEEIICPRCQRGEYCPENEHIEMMKLRPLLGQLLTIHEFEGRDIMGYYMKGHVDKKDFIFEMLEENDLLCDEKNIDHTYARYTPVRGLDDMMMIFVNEPARGAFGITHIDEHDTIYVTDDE